MTKDLDQKVAHAMGLKSVNNCEKWGTSMTQEALKLALEALEYWDVHGKLHQPTEEAITAIKEALAQPERDYERGFIDGMQKQMQSSVDKAVNRMAQTQEPWCMKMNDCKTKCEDCPDEPPQHTERPVDCERCNRLEEQAYDLVGKLRVANIKLSMQPQRTWVDLTDEELKSIEENTTFAGNESFLRALTRNIEAKLKELNT